MPSTLITGILHGCTGTGHLLGVMPALAMPSWLCACAYLTSFGLGTMVAMSLFTAIVGEASAQLSTRLNQHGRAVKTPPLQRLRLLDLAAVHGRTPLRGGSGRLDPPPGGEAGPPGLALAAATTVADSTALAYPPRRDLPAKMAMASSIFALVMGSVWTARACAALSLPQLVAKWAGASLAMLGAKRLGVAVAA